MLSTLLIRADASAQMGTGHVMRMIALAQAYMRRGGRVVLVSVQCPPLLIERVREHGIEHQLLAGCGLGDEKDAKATLELCVELETEWMVLDGYHFDKDYQKNVVGNGAKVLAIDDYGHCETWHCDAVLNQNLGAEQWSHRQTSQKETAFFLGSSFTLLRQEFEKGIARAKEVTFPLRNILITLGGSDFDNVTKKVLEGFDSLGGASLSLRVLIGCSNAHRDCLERLARASHHDVELLDNVRDMPSMYAWADGVISAGGSTCWEWLSYGLPGIVVTIADNQKPLEVELRKRHLALCLGWHADSSAERYAEHIAGWLKGTDAQASFEVKRQLFDAQGAARVASFLT